LRTVKGDFSNKKKAHPQFTDFCLPASGWEGRKPANAGKHPDQLSSYGRDDEDTWPD